MSEPTPQPKQVARILLTGFMGAGKSTVGALLAARLGWPFADSDHFIEERAGATIAELFRRDGEAAFRRLEAETVGDLMQRAPLVLALGGGALETQATVDLLADAQDTFVTFLDAPLDALVERCMAQPGAAERPVLADRARLEERLAGRLPFYRQAHLTVSTRGIAPDAVADRILAELGARAVKTREGATV